MRSPLTLAKFTFLLLLLGLSASAVAERVEGLFEVVRPVADEGSDVRNAAMADGLAEMLVRLSGDGNILQKLVPPPAGAYVKQYRYEGRTPGDLAEPGAKQIRLQYNSTRIMDFLRTNGFAIWGEQRAVAVVWLAIRDGRNQYLLKASDISLFKDQVDKLLKQRGVPALWPSYDKKDQAIVKFADVWAGFSEPLLQASARYSSGPILAGNLAWNGTAWSGDWVLLDQRFSQRASVRGLDYEQLLSDAINQLSDAMGKQYAVLESTDSSADALVTLDIENVTSLASYVRLKQYLSSLQAVQNVQLSQVAGDKARFQLSLRSKIDDLVNLLANSSLLRKVDKAPPAGISPVATSTNTLPLLITPVATSQPYHYRLVN